MIMDQLPSVLTVSQLTAEIRQILEAKYRFVSVSGEISNLKVPFSGHSYFTLKDEGAQLRAVLFKGQQRYLSEPLRDGQHIVCRGRISVYEPRGDYQLIVDTVDQYGIGVLQMKFAALKKKLADEGLFDRAHKLPIPPFPRHVVVVSSATGAAIKDFLKICSLRKSPAHIQLYPVPVQGEQAPAAIARAIAVINRRVNCDLIVLCRGGGSIEDLWAFNEEEVARAIHDSTIPIVTGIGHETDTTIADLCADLRCPTPTGAAERVMPDSTLLLQEIHALTRRLRRGLQLRVDLAVHSLNRHRQHLRAFGDRVEKLSLRLDPQIEDLHRAGRFFLARRQEKVANLLLRLEHQAPLTQITLKSQVVSHLERNLRHSMSARLSHNEERLGRAMALLQGVSPLSTLARGYSIVHAIDSRGNTRFTVTDACQVDIGDRVRVRLSRGGLLCVVQSKDDKL